MTDHGRRRFQGRVEHIDTGHAIRFRSFDEFVDFIEQMLADCSEPDCGERNQPFRQYGSEEMAPIL